MYNTKTKRAAALNELVATGQLTPEGKRWLIEALDPFHDEQIQLTGFPDMNVSSSVVQLVKKQQDIKKSAGLPAGNWDCNIVMWPQPQQNFEDGSSGESDYTVRAYTTEDSDNNASLSAGGFVSTIFRYPIGGITAYEVAAGNPTYGNDTAAGDATVCDLSLDTTYLDGASRVIAMGFEVVNTTAPLNKQGSVTVYRQPTPQPGNLYTAWVYDVQSSELDDLKAWIAKETPNALPNDARKGVEEQGGEVEFHCSREQYLRFVRERREVRKATVRKQAKNVGAESIRRQGYISVWSAAQPPETLAEATLLTGSQTWEAEKGCYCIATMNTLDNPAKVQMPQLIIYWTAPVDALGGSGLGLGTGISDVDGDASPFNGRWQPAMQYIAPFNIAGAYFTGLSDETTLRISCCWYVERFPDPQEKDLVVLASPSPGHDAMAMDIYAKAMRMLPVGVQQNENPFGEWFGNVVRSIGKVVVPALKGAGVVNPLAGALGTIGESLLDAMGPGESSSGGQRAKQRKKAEGNKANPPAPVRKAGNANTQQRKNKRKKKGQAGKAGPKNQAELLDLLRRIKAG